MLEYFIEYLEYGYVINGIMFIIMLILTVQYAFTVNAVFMLPKMESAKKEYIKIVPISYRIFTGIVDIVVPYYLGYKIFKIIIKVLSGHSLGEVIINEYNYITKKFQNKD